MSSISYSCEFSSRFVFFVQNVKLEVLSKQERRVYKVTAINVWMLAADVHGAVFLVEF